MNIMEELRLLIKGEVFDYKILMHSLRAYKKPRDKISQLLKNESIIRIKKGVYIFGPLYRKDVISKEIIAAVLVQPSYISKEYALSFYGFFPEHVERVTSMTTRKRKHFETPIGQFEYYSLSKKKFSIGVEIKEIPQEGGYLFATKEKALADWIASAPPIRNKESLEFFLYDESRIDPSSLLPVNHLLLEEIAKVYRNRNVDLLLTL